MPKYETSGVGPIAEAGELPQSKQYGSTSTRSSQNEKAGNSDEQSQFFVTPPSLSLPKAGGVVRGIGEKFNANPFTGTANVSIPVTVTPGRGGVQPDLTLSYASGSSNGVFGMGWSLSLPVISRKTDKKLPEYRDDIDSDTFILAGAEDLVPKSGADAEILNAQDAQGNQYHVRRYIPRVEQAFSLIEKWTRIDDDVHWRTVSKDNITAIYGRGAESRITDPNQPTHIFSWLLCEVRDGKGNLVRYEYKQEDSVGAEASIEDQRVANSNQYIKTIYYGNQLPDIFGERSTADHHWYFRVEFDYGDHQLDQVDNNRWAYSTGYDWHYRPDAFSNYRPGFEVRTRRRCNRVLMFHHFPEELDEHGNRTAKAEEGGDPFLVASTKFTYNDYTDVTPHALMMSVSYSGYQKQANGSYQKQSMPPVNYEYSIPQIASQQSFLNPSSLENLPEGLAGGKYQLVDLDGVGVQGIITDQAGHWYYKEGLGEDGFGAMHPLPNKPSPGNVNAGQQLQDLDGDGLLSVVSYNDTLPGYFERTKDKLWKSFKTFKTLPNIDWQDPNLQMLDLNGDGFADILITQEQFFIWYPSAGRDGFSEPKFWPKPQDEEKGPALVFNDITSSIYIADMSGDGLQDICRIRNGNVCYWPNLGYGRFGEQRLLANAPRMDSQDQYNPQQLKLADIDGTGTTDLLYLGATETAYWLNLSGNRFSEKQTINAFPVTDNLSSVQLADIKSNGTSCLVWSSSLAKDAQQPLKYVSLRESVQKSWNQTDKQYQSENIIAKAYLLTAIENNMGARTEIRYKPSTHYYLEDKKAGKAWQTRLPMPVQVVDKVKTIDLITNTVYTGQYKYHHGYFDGVEREFRGFACVEQIDSDNYNSDNQLDQ